jgi:hypothetical protein
MVFVYRSTLELATRVEKQLEYKRTVTALQLHNYFSTLVGGQFLRPGCASEILQATEREKEEGGSDERYIRY